MPRRVAIVALLAGFLACAGHRPPGTPDGLERVPTSLVWGAFARPGTALAGYESLRFEFAGISYKGSPRYADGRRPHVSLHAQEVELSPSDEARVERHFREIFEREFARHSSFDLAHSSGPGTLTVRAHVLDMVVRRGGPVPHTHSSFGRSAPSFTLVLDVRDSQTNQALARVVDRRSAAVRYGAPVLSESAVVNNSGLRHVMRRWARALRLHLESLRA